MKKISAILGTTVLVATSTGYTFANQSSIMQVSTHSLNVRSGPSTAYERLGVLSLGDKVEVVEQSSGWAKIKYNNGYGWCSSSYLTSSNKSISNESPQNTTQGYHLVINSYKNTMGYYKNGKLIKTFSVATGKSSTQTPTGKFKIVNKIKNRPYYTDNIPGGDPRNPLGDRWLGLQVNGSYGDLYGIHGNNNAGSIGYNISKGCIRMHNNDVRWLYDQVPTGTTVIISNSPTSNREIASWYHINLE